MDDREEFIAQFIPGGTGALTMFSPESGDQWFLTRIWITNNDTLSQQYTLYLDNEGGTYSNATNIAHLVTLDPGVGEYVDLNIPMRNSAGNFAVKISLTFGFTFTLFGIKL